MGHINTCALIGKVTAERDAAIERAEEAERERDDLRRQMEDAQKTLNVRAWTDTNTTLQLELGNVRAELTLARKHLATLRDERRFQLVCAAAAVPDMQDAGYAIRWADSVLSEYLAPRPSAEPADIPLAPASTRSADVEEFLHRHDRGQR